MKHLVSKTAYTGKRITITFANVSKDTLPVAKVYVEKQYLGATIINRPIMKDFWGVNTCFLDLAPGPMSLTPQLCP